jgi:hypothetical protein
VRLSGPPAAQLFAVPVQGEPTNPTPGPSLAIQVSGGRSVHLATAYQPTD